MADIKVLIVVNNEEAAVAYSLALSEIGVAYDIVPTFGEMSELAIRNAYNGLVVDILTLVRCSKEDKVIAYECINLFPVLRVKWEAKHKQIKLSPLEQTFCPDAESALRFFIDNRCSSFPARSLRRHQRKQVNLNLLVSLDGSFALETTHKTFTLNISDGGAFIHSMQSFEPGQILWLRFLELADQAPIAARVCWSLSWGESRCIPGVGVMFDIISEHQQQEIQRVF